VTKRPQKWKRKGYETEAEYRAACRAKQRTEKAALLATKAENKALEILRILWRKAEFDEPVVKITKEQIMGEARCGLTTVKEALRDLREEGSLKPIYLRGGRGLPAKYRLGVSGMSQTPSDEAIEAMQHERDREAAWRFLRDKYGPMKAMELLGDPPERD